MNLSYQIILVVRGLLARKGRTFLTILGIVIGVAGVIIIIALGAGAQSLVLSQVNKLGSNLISIEPGKSDETGPPAAVFGISVTTLTDADSKALRNNPRLPDVTSVVGIARGSATVVAGDQSLDTSFTGAEASYIDVINADLELGRFMTKSEADAGANVIMLGYSVNQDLFGDNNSLGQVVKIKNIPFEVIGVMKKQGTVAFQNQDDQVFIPLIIAQRQILGIRHLQAIRLKINGTVPVDFTIDEIKQVLRERHKIKSADEDDFSVRNLADAIKLLTSITDGLRLFLVAMAGISLLVGGIGIMNIMLVTVAERTREIGLRKSIGATNRAIRNQFLLEAGVITLMGGILGIMVGAVVAYAIALGARYAGYDWAFVISPLSIVLALFVSVGTGVVFGLYPAVKASKLNPIDALRYE